MADTLSIEDYLDYLGYRNATNAGSTRITPFAPTEGLNAREMPDPEDLNDPYARLRKSLGVYKDPVPDTTTMDKTLEYLGSAVWGGLSGLTWGATEFVKKSTPWEEMTDSERAGWITGEGLSLATPFVGPFHLLGKGGRLATKALRGNRYIRKAAKNLVNEKSGVAKALIDDAVTRGDLPVDVAKGMKKQIEKQLPKKLLGDKHLRSRLADLSADQRVAESASVGLQAQSEELIGRILKEYKFRGRPGIARDMSKEFVDQLAKGRYVNDIGEYVTRGFGGRNPGRIAQYTGMAAQDFLYMGLHSLGTTKIKSMAHGTQADYSDVPKHVLGMALAFPLIRGIGKGGRETLVRGIQSYAKRFNKINYNKISKMPGGDATVKELLKSNLKGANLNIDFHSDHAKKFWTVGGKRYGGKESIMNALDTGKLDTKDTVILLNKMRKDVSKQLVSRWNNNYWGDLLASIPRMGMGVAFVNFEPMIRGAFDNMSPQEFSSHMFMAAFMTKSRGAWDHAGRRGYMSREYGNMEKALNWLQVDHTKMNSTIRALKIEQILNERGLIFGNNPIAEDIINKFDSVLESEVIKWRNNGEFVDPTEYQDVHALLGAYNAIKKQKNANYDPLTIQQFTPAALNMLKQDLAGVVLQGRKISDMTPNEIQVQLSKESRDEIQADHYRFLRLAKQELDFPIDMRLDETTGKPIKVLAKRLESKTDERIPNIMEYNELLAKHSKDLNIDVKDDPVDVDALSTRMGFKNLKDFDNAFGKLINDFIETTQGKYENHNIHMRLDKNIFLDGIRNIDQVEAKDDFFKLVTGQSTDKVELKNLRQKFLNVFGEDGFYKKIYENQIDDTVKIDDLSDTTYENLLYIEPIYELMKSFHPKGPRSSPKRDITSKEIKELAEQSKDVIQRLPSDWRENLFVEAMGTFQGRLFAGGNRMAYTAFSRARDAGLIEAQFQEGIQRIIFPDDFAIDSEFKTDPATGLKVKEAINNVKNLFKPQMVREEAFVKEGVDLRDWISISDEIVNSKVKHFVENIDKTLKGLDKDGIVVSQVRVIKDLSKVIMEELSNPRESVDVKKVRESIQEMRILVGALQQDPNASPDTVRRLEGALTSLEKGFKDMGTLDTPAVSRELHDTVIESFDELIRTEMEKDYVEKTKLSNLLVKLHNHSAGLDPALTPADSKYLFEQLLSDFSRLLKDSVTKEATLEDMVSEFNNSRNWQDAKAAIDSVVKMYSSFNTNLESYNQEAARTLNELQNEKLPQHRPISFLELLTKYPSLRDAADPNKVDNKFVVDITNAYDSNKTITPDEVFEKYIYPDIIKKYPTSHATEIEAFKIKEAEPLLQNIFGRKNRQRMSFDHQLAKLEDVKVTESLSTRTLDRVYTNDPENKYEWILLKGSIKIGGRVVNMDESYDVGGNWKFMQTLVDRGIDVNMDNVADLQMKLRNIDYQLQVDDLLNLEPVVNSTKVYMRLSPKMRIIFPKTPDNMNLLHRDFDSVYEQKLLEYDPRTNNKIKSEKRLIAFKKGFKDLYQTTDSDNLKLRLKMQLVHFSRTMGPEFDKMMNTMDMSRGKLEYNALKRGFLADGGTGTSLTREALTWGMQNSPDADVRLLSERILNEGTIRIGVLGDEAADPKDSSHFFSNKKSIVKKLKDKYDNIRGANNNQDTIESKIVNAFSEDIGLNKYPSLDSYFLDGGKFASTSYSNLLKAKKGGGKWNGMKTTIMSNDMLGKGFTSYNKKIADILDHLGVDILVGETVAKTLNRGKVKPFEIDRTLNLEQGWEAQLRNMSMQSNVLRVPYEAFNVSFTTHSDAGINYSSSMFDFQDLSHLNRAKELYRVDKVIDKMAELYRQKDYASGELIRALYNIKEQETGLKLTTDAYELTEFLVAAGGREANPLVQKNLLRLLQSDFYKILTKRSTIHGEDSISAPDVDNTLSNPVYARMQIGAVDKPINSVFQFGGGSITHALSKVKIADEVLSTKWAIDEIPFIARDPKTGLDIVLSFKDGKIEYYSPLLEAQKKMSDDKRIIGLGKGERIKIDETHINNIKKTLEHLRDQSVEAKNMNYGDLIRLLNGEVYSKSKRYTGLVKYGLTGSYRRLARKYNIQLGMSVNAIPKVLKDQPLMRVEKVLSTDEAGLSTINTFDLRVTMQRDFDGDHIYKYLKLPRKMMRDYVDDMGDIVDYRKFDDDAVEYGKMDMFGFGDPKVAGSDSDLVGFDKVANDIATKKKIVSSVISRKGTLSYLLNSGMTIDGEFFIKKNFNKKGAMLAATDAIDVFQRSGDIFQNTLDIWQKTPKIAKAVEMVENYFLYGEHLGTSPRKDHTKESFFGMNFGVTQFEKDLFKVMHRTLSKSRVMQNDIWDVAGQRQPRTDELRRYHSDIKSFFENPNVFLMRKMLKQARILRRKGKSDEAGKMIAQIMDYWFSYVGRGTKAWENVETELSKGNIHGKGVRSRMKMRFKFDNKVGIGSSMSGHILDRAVSRPVFYDRANKIEHTKTFSLYKSFNQLRNKLEFMQAMGDLTTENIDDIILQDRTYQTLDEKGNSMFRANLLGNLKHIADNQYGKALRSLSSLMNESFPDANKIERAQDRIMVMTDVINALDRQMSRNMILRKDKDLEIRSFKKKKDDSAIYGYIDFKRTGNLYRIKGDITKDSLDPKRSPKDLEFVTSLKKNKKEKFQYGYTYLIDKRPTKFKALDDVETRYDIAWGKATRLGNLKMDDLVNIDVEPITFVKFNDDITRLKVGISDIYSKTLDAVKENLIDKGDIFIHNSVHTDRKIDEFFDTWTRKIDFGTLLAYLLQPQPVRNTYIKEGTREIPYFKMNTHLIESVFKWMRRKPFPGQESVEEKYNIDAEELIRALMHDTNAHLDHKTDDIEYKVREYNRMRKEGKEDWEKLNQSTMDILTGDWYRHPVLSSYSRSFFLGKARLYKGKSMLADNEFFYDYRSDKPRDMKRILGCK